MNILVTGSSGLIGSLLVKKLSKSHSVQAFDIASGQDLLDYSHCLSACSGIDLVVHAGAVLDEQSPDLWKVNVGGTKNILNAAIERKVPRFIFLSSVGVYGSSKTIVTEESDFAPETLYEKSKAAADDFVSSKKDLININIVQPSIVVAVNAYWKKIVSFIKKNLPVVGNGDNYWQTVYVDDAVDFIVFLIGKKVPSGERFIVAEENPLTLNEFILTVRKELGLRPSLIHVPFFLAWPCFAVYGAAATFFGRRTLINTAYLHRLLRTRYFSISKIKELGFTPKYGFKTAIKKVLKSPDFFR